MNDRSRKHALVTGATRGFGKAIALLLAGEGVGVAMNFHRGLADAEAVLGEIRQLGGEAFALRADIGNEDKLDRMFETIRSRPGNLDILVANAAFGVPGSLMEASAEQRIKEGKHALNWARFSSHDFVDNQVRLQLFALAYNLGNFLRQLVLPKLVTEWSLKTLREKLITIGAKVVRHARYVTFQMAEA